MKNIKLTLTLLFVALVSVAHLAAAGESFESRDYQILSEDGGLGNCTLGATLLLPRAQKSKALILFVHGSGTLNRDEQSPEGNVPFKEIAERLSGQGFSTFRFDKRGIQPECRAKLVNNPELTPWNFVNDVKSVIHFANSLPELRDLDLILVGHSEGVNFVTEIAEELPRLRGLILLAGLGRYAIDETLLRQLRENLEAPNLPPEIKEQLEKAIADGDIYFRNVRVGKASPTDCYFRMCAKYWQDWITITARGAASAHQVSQPSLVIRGTADTNVTIEDFLALREAISGVPGSADYAPNGLDHFFAPEGSIKVREDVLEKISNWLKTIFP